MATVTRLEMIKISIKRILIWITIVTAISSILIFSFVSNQFLDNYFDSFIEEGYQQQVNNIVEYGKVVIEELHVQRSTLNSYVVDPIYYVEILDPSENVLTYSGSVISGTPGGTGGPGRGVDSPGYGSGGSTDDTVPIFEYDAETMTKHIAPIIVNDLTIGSAVIVRAKNTDDTRTMLFFHSAIINGAIYASLFAILIVGVLSFILIRLISRDTRKVMAYVSDDNAKSTAFLVREYGTITEAVDDYRERIALKEKVRKEKFDRLLHDTKTPLTVLKSQLEGAVDGIIEVDKERAGNMVEVVDNLTDMLWNVTNIIEGNETSSDLLMETVDYSNHLIKIVSSLQSKFRSKDLGLIYDQKEFLIQTDVQMLNNIIYNVLINSFKYTESGQVTISTSNNCLSIRDTGIGISSADLQQIFKPYFRGKNIGRAVGDGLGLFNVKTNLAMMGAQIEVSSKLDKFTEFVIIFQ